jgi:hypothetical protein
VANGARELLLEQDVGPIIATTRMPDSLARFEVFGRHIEHVTIPLEALVQGMVEHGLPRPVAEVYASFDMAIAKGELATVSDAVQHVTGRTPQSLRDYLVANRTALASPPQP